MQLLARIFHGLEMNRGAVFLLAESYGACKFNIWELHSEVRCGGAVWCGAVWCGAVWCGAVWCGAVRFVKNGQKPHRSCTVANDLL